jgi:hypothetical protein
MFDIVNIYPDYKNVRFLNLISLLAFVVAFLVLANITWVLPISSSVYFGFIAFTLVIMFIISERKVLSGKMISLYFVIFISILLNEIPSFFSPYSRFIGFIVFTFLVGPGLLNKSFGIFKMLTFKYLLFFLQIIIFFSFLGLILNVSSFFGRGGFTGLFIHSMLMAPFSAILLIVSIDKLFSKRRVYLHILFIIQSFLCCVASGSRSSLLAAILGVLFYYLVKHNFKIGKYAKSIFIIVFVGLITFPLWEAKTDAVLDKFEYSAEQGDLIYSRAFLWNSRFEEFNSSPLYGIGFSSVFENIDVNYYDKETGNVEPGSSWLAIISMTGAIGLIVFLSIVISNFKYVLNNGLHDNKPLLSGLFLFFIIHMFFEGYVFSAGSATFITFWLLLGVFRIHTYKN